MKTKKKKAGVVINITRHKNGGLTYKADIHGINYFESVGILRDLLNEMSEEWNTQNYYESKPRKGNKSYG